MDSNYNNVYTQIENVRDGLPILTCNYRSSTYSFLALLCIGLTLMGGWGFVATMIAGDMEGVIAMFFILSMFWVLTVVFIALMINPSLTIYNRGIVYKNVFGKEYAYYYEQIQYYRIVHSPMRSSRDYIRIHIQGKDICFGACGRNYGKLCAFFRNTSIPQK